MLFQKKDLYKLIMPLLIEQFLAVAVGLADSIMIAGVGEAAVSAVSLVDSINILIINIFTALATGGAVVAGHSLGRKDMKRASLAAEQLLLFVGIAALAVTAAVLLGQRLILTKVFGKIEPDVMGHARTYLWITALSFPFIAVYNGGAAIFRVMNNAAISMKTSLLMNGMNVCGNAILIYGFGMGTAGAAIPTLVSRAVAAVVIIVLLFRPDLQVHLRRPFSFRPDFSIIKKICYIGIPNGIESSVFQLGKVLVLSLVAGFGTISIAANAVANSIGSFQILPGVAINLAIVTVVSQCAGIGDFAQVRYYTKQLLKYIYASMAVMNVLVIVFCTGITKIYNLTPETGILTRQLLLYSSICSMTIWPLSFSLPNTFRAVGEVRFPMCISMLSMWIFRIAFSFLLGKTAGLGVFGVWVAMTIDWLFRGIVFSIYYRKGKWTQVHQI